jgi:REP element-mobilizing transposase RayT
MILNDLGKIVYDEILDLPKHFYYLGLDEFIVMPNHLHLILFLNNCCRDVSRRDARRDVSCRDVSQKHLYNNEDDKNKYYSNISPQK